MLQTIFQKYHRVNSNGTKSTDFSDINNIDEARFLCSVLVEIISKHKKKEKDLEDKSKQFKAELDLANTLIEFYSICRGVGVDGSSSSNSSNHHYYYSGNSSNHHDKLSATNVANEIDKNNINSSSNSNSNAMSGKQPLSAIRKNKRKQHELGYRPRAYVRRKPREQTNPSIIEGSNHSYHLDTINNPSQGD